MKKLIIYEFQVKHLLDTFNYITSQFNCSKKETCMDRDVMQSREMLTNVLNEEIDKNTSKSRYV
jgi:hypothetical protein